MTTDLQGRLDAEFPPAVILEEGQSFIGTYLRLEQGYAEYRGPVWVMVFATDDGEERCLWPLHRALINGLKRLRPKPGDRVGVKCLGKRRSQGGTAYIDWRCAIDRSATWDDVSAEDGEP
jgi:hypothetical protein